MQAAEREIDVEKQMQIVENLMQTGIKVLCDHAERLARDRLGARQGEGRRTCRSSIVDTRVDAKAAADAGVQTETFVGSDNYEGGKLAGEYVVKATGGKARVGILEGIPGHETGDSRLRGFRDAVAKASRASPSSRRSPPTGSATRASTCSRTCCRRMPTSTPCLPPAI